MIAVLAISADVQAQSANRVAPQISEVTAPRGEASETYQDAAKAKLVRTGATYADEVFLRYQAGEYVKDSFDSWTARR